MYAAPVPQLICRNDFPRRGAEGAGVFVSASMDLGYIRIAVKGCICIHWCLVPYTECLFFVFCKMRFISGLREG